MCRLIGEYRLNSELTGRDVFVRLTQQSKPGGPDDTDFYQDSRVQFGFNRLAILDLSDTGRQPMVSSSGRYTVVFNGEIYNFNKLRSRLKSYTSFKGTGDTETLVHCIDEWGVEEAIKQLDGMFAIAVYDKKRDCISLIRDFAGIKPLFYGLNSRGLVFASQYNQVASHPWFSDEGINDEVLSLYLRMHYVPAPYGMLDNTFQVLPGEIITINNQGSVAKNRYWELPVDVEADILEQSAAIHHLKTELNTSVRNQLISDVPLGAFLSGGIDSALICNFASQNITNKLSTCTIGSDSKTHDETYDAGIVAKALGAEMNIEIMNSSSALSIIDNAFDALSEPFADFSIIPTYLVSKLAREKVTVALSGDGGDELFFGYERFGSVTKNHEYLRYPYYMKYLLYGTDKVLFKNRHVNSGVLFNKSGVAHRELHSRFKGDRLLSVFPGYNKTVVDSGFGVYDYKNGVDEVKLLNSMRYAEFYGMMQKTLRKVDQASMGVGLEVRVPFLSKQFIEASLKVSPYLSFGSGKKKDILKVLLKDQIPEVRITEQKRGFTIPLTKWINEDLKEYFDDTLMSTSSAQTFGFNKKGIENLLKTHHTKEADVKWPLFTLLSLFKWKEKNQI